MKHSWQWDSQRWNVYLTAWDWALGAGLARGSAYNMVRVTMSRCWRQLHWGHTLAGGCGPRPSSDNCGPAVVAHCLVTSSHMTAHEYNSFHISWSGHIHLLCFEYAFTQYNKLWVYSMSRTVCFTRRINCIAYSFLPPIYPKYHECRNAMQWSCVHSTLFQKY